MARANSLALLLQDCQWHSARPFVRCGVEITPRQRRAHQGETLRKEEKPVIAPAAIVGSLSINATPPSLPTAGAPQPATSVAKAGGVGVSAAFTATTNGSGATAEARTMASLLTPLDRG